MAKGDNQKLKMLYLVQIFSESTDDTHGLTMPEVIEKLAVCQVNADRKTLYQDFEELTHFGFEIISEKVGRNTYYHLGSRRFELAELKLLVDSVQAAKFITGRKSKDLIKKLEGLVSTHEAKQLQRQVVITGRIKTPNKKVYYNVDMLHSAISENRQVTFRYFQWNEKKQQVLRHDGALYHVSPWSLTWDNEYYYLVGYDAADEKIKHYRVDKMLDLSVLNEARKGQKAFRDFDLARYSKSLFGMFAGEEVSVSLEARNDMAAVLIDRFGKDVPLIPKDEGHFTTHVNVALSRQFLGWIMALGDGIRITGPEAAVQMMQEETRRLAEQYL